MRKKSFSLLDDIARLKDCNVRVELVNKESGAFIKNKSLDSFLGNKDKILNEWDVHQFVVAPTKEAIVIETVTTEESDAEEAVLDDSGTS